MGDEETAVLSVRLPKSELERINQLVKESGMIRSEFLRSLVKAAIAGEVMGIERVVPHNTSEPTELVESVEIVEAEIIESEIFETTSQPKFVTTKNGDTFELPQDWLDYAAQYPDKWERMKADQIESLWLEVAPKLFVAYPEGIYWDVKEKNWFIPDNLDISNLPLIRERKFPVCYDLSGNYSFLTEEELFEQKKTLEAYTPIAEAQIKRWELDEHDRYFCPLDQKPISAQALRVNLLHGWLECNELAFTRSVLFNSKNESDLGVGYDSFGMQRVRLVPIGKDGYDYDFVLYWKGEGFDPSWLSKACFGNGKEKPKVDDPDSMKHVYAFEMRGSTLETRIKRKLKDGGDLFVQYSAESTVSSLFVVSNFSKYAPANVLHGGGFRGTENLPLRLLTIFSERHLNAIRDDLQEEIWGEVREGEGIPSIPDHMLSEVAQLLGSNEMHIKTLSVFNAFWFCVPEVADQIVSEDPEEYGDAESYIIDECLTAFELQLLDFAKARIGKIRQLVSSGFGR